MRRHLFLLTALFVVIAATAAQAAIYPYGTAIDYTRQFPSSYIPIGIPATVHVEFTNDESGPITGLYYSEQLPSWLNVQAGTVRLNGTPIAVSYEYGDVIVVGRRAHRWVIDNPTAPGGRSVIGPGDTVTIDYTIRATQVAAFQPNADGWFGILNEAEAVPVHGWDPYAPVVRFVQSTDSAPLAAGNRLAPAFPNPFNPKTTLRFESDAHGPLQLVVLDAAGRCVRRLAEGSFPAGHHSVEWDGCDDAGHPLPSGLYLARLLGDQGPVGSQKLMLLK